MSNIRITPALLNQVAARHESVADEIAVARSAGSDILAAVATHGPIMHQFKAATNEVVQRRAAPSPTTKRLTVPQPTNCVLSQHNSASKKR